MNALEDRTVPDKQSWDSAISFMESMVKEKLKESNKFYNYKFCLKKNSTIVNVFLIKFKLKSKNLKVHL